MKYRGISENHLYKKVYAKGKKCAAANVIVNVLPDYAAARLCRANPRKSKINRIGISVSKKIGGAVARNRVKRIIREAYRQCDIKSDIKKGFLIVIAAREHAVNVKMQEVERDLKFAFSKLDMLNNISGNSENSGSMPV